MSEQAGLDSETFAPDRWAVAGGQCIAPPPAAPKSRQGGRSGRYLKGPVSWPWLSRAMALPGKALAVGLILWHLRGMAGRNTVLFCLTRAEAEGIPATTGRRAVKALERAGLVSVVRRPGRGLDVTILEAPPE